MKLIALCLLAACCCALADAANRMNQRRKLQEVLRQLNDVKNLQHTEKMLNTPPAYVEDCCCRSALECFRANMQVHFNVTEKKQSTLYKSLRSPLTLSGLDFCNSGNNMTTCHNCDSHPKANVEVFFNRLESLIQRAISRLRKD